MEELTQELYSSQADQLTTSLDHLNSSQAKQRASKWEMSSGGGASRSSGSTGGASLPEDQEAEEETNLINFKKSNSLYRGRRGGT